MVTRTINMAFSILGLTISWPLVGTIAAILIGREIWNLTYFWRRGVPGPRPLPLLGNIMSMTKGIHVYYLECQEKYGNVIGSFVFRSPVYVIGDPDMIKDITIKNFSKFVNHESFVLKNRPFDKGLTVLQDDHWKRVRNVVTPTFSALKMKQMSTLINECCDNLVRNVADKNGADMNVVSLFEGFTMDGIAKCAFGLQVDSQTNPDNQFVKNAKIIMSGDVFSPMIMLSGIFPPFAHMMNFLDIGMFPKSVMNFFGNVVQKAMEMRKESTGNERKDFLQLMMKAHEDEEHKKESKLGDNKDGHDLHCLTDEHHEAHSQDIKTAPKIKLTLEEILAQALLFFIAGFETTNIALSFLAYSLATNPEVQAKLIEEVDEVTPTRDSVNYSNVAQMPYLDGAVCETLRLYPPAAMTDRKCNETYTYNGVTIPKGSQVMFNMFALHRNPEIWNDPLTFDPTRFLKENRELRHECSWLPFGSGPRNCVGMRFALMEIKMAVARIVQKYQFELSPETEVPVTMGVKNMKPPNGITLRIVERK